MRTSVPDPLKLVRRAWADIARWERSFGRVAPHPALAVQSERLASALDEYLGRLTAPTTAEAPGTYPFHHPRYAGQMLKPPHPVALAAYAAAARLNPNNHALDGGPPTGRMEKEVVAELAAMLGFGKDHLGHLTGGGTVANLEALFVAREEARKMGSPEAIAVSESAHYTHARMAHVLGLAVETIPADGRERMRLDVLEEVLRREAVSTVVLTAGTTGLGSVDPIGEAILLARRYGARVHVDAAYGGFFTLLARGKETGLHGFPAVDFRAIADADSVVIDPHKHGLQPYGCGCVLFADASVGQYYRHDSPYTYFTSEELHLGEISLECSRPGAAAGALWLTLRALPLAADEGLGPILSAGLRAARDWSARIEASEVLDLITPPETDIVVYAPRAESASATDRASQAVFDAAMSEDEPVFLSLYRLGVDRLARRLPHLTRDADAVRVLRSVLMKPEHEQYVDVLHETVTSCARSLT